MNQSQSITGYKLYHKDNGVTVVDTPRPAEGQRLSIAIGALVCFLLVVGIPGTWLIIMLHDGDRATALGFSFPLLTCAALGLCGTAWLAKLALADGVRWIMQPNCLEVVSTWKYLLKPKCEVFRNGILTLADNPSTRSKSWTLTVKASGTTYVQTKILAYGIDSQDAESLRNLIAVATGWQGDET